jgi:integrase
MPLSLFKKTTKTKQTWWTRGRITVNGQTTYIKRSTKYQVGTVAAKRGAERFAAELEVTLLSQAHGYEPTPVQTLAQYWTRTYEPVYTSRKKSARVDRYMMAHALPYLGDLALTAITRSACERYLNVRRSAVYGKTPKATAEGTVQRERSFLAAVLEKAKQDGLITANPMRGIKATPYAVRERLVTAELQTALLARLSPQFQRWVRFLLGTGLRLAECCGLTPADVDLERRLVKVSAAHAKLGKARVVPLPAALVPIVKAQIAAEGRLWPQSQATLRAVLTDACAAVKAGRHANQFHVGPRPALPRISPHDLRHTFGHRWLKGGGDIYTLSKILGNTLAVCSRHYAHLLTEDISAKADAVELGV